MKIPSSLKIGGHVYTVRVLKNIAKDDDFFKKECGDTSLSKCEIRIDGNQVASQQEETLIHEVLHAINNTIDHALLHSIAHAFHQVLRDNKLLK